MKVTEIHQGSSATGYLRVGDVIVSIQGQVIENHEDAFRLIYSIFPGEEILVRYLRGGIQGEVSYNTGSFRVTGYSDTIILRLLNIETGELMASVTKEQI